MSPLLSRAALAEEARIHWRQSLLATPEGVVALLNLGRRVNWRERDVASVCPEGVPLAVPAVPPEGL